MKALGHVQKKKKKNDIPLVFSVLKKERDKLFKPQKLHTKSRSISQYVQKIYIYI